MELNQKQRQDAWEGSELMWAAVYYASVAITTVIALLEDPAPALRLRILVLATGIGLWHAGLLWLWRRLPDLRARPRIIVPAIALGLVVWFLLIRANPVFYFILLGLYPVNFLFLPLRWAIMISLVLTGVIILEQTTGSGTPLRLSDPQIWYYGGLMLLGIFMGVWINAIIQQSMERRALIEQLQAAQADLAAAQRREGMLQERQRLAGDIHDTLAQGFTSIVMHLEAAEQALPDDLATLGRHLNRARQTARDSLSQARQVVHDLRPELLAHQSLPQALARVVSRWSEESGIPATFTATGDVLPLHPDCEVTLLRATQEGLANVRKHAGAGSASITLSYLVDTVILDIQDDGAGVGEPVPSPLSGGFGLAAMRERVARLGGTVELESEPGEGTTLAIVLPALGAAGPAAGSDAT